MMRTTYDPEADAFYAPFAPDGVAVAKTEEVGPGLSIDLDEAGHMFYPASLM